ncbi:hypothetical protein C8Q75DRAFT_804935 [Abortiporus biennis]|nr:hypothetical protein C8Q75DRAFT_804935 [Abortiporus biennis]
MDSTTSATVSWAHIRISMNETSWYRFEYYIYDDSIPLDEASEDQQMESQLVFQAYVTREVEEMRGTWNAPFSPAEDWPSDPWAEIAALQQVNRNEEVTNEAGDGMAEGLVLGNPSDKEAEVRTMQVEEMVEAEESGTNEEELVWELEEIQRSGGLRMMNGQFGH